MQGHATICDCTFSVLRHIVNTSKYAVVWQCRGKRYHEGGSKWPQWIVLTPKKMWTRVWGGGWGL